MSEHLSSEGGSFGRVILGYNHRYIEFGTECTTAGARYAARYRRGPVIVVTAVAVVVVAVVLRSKASGYRRPGRVIAVKTTIKRFRVRIIVDDRRRCRVLRPDDRSGRRVFTRCHCRGTFSSFAGRYVRRFTGGRRHRAVVIFHASPRYDAIAIDAKRFWRTRRAAFRDSGVGRFKMFATPKRRRFVAETQRPHRVYDETEPDVNGRRTGSTVGRRHRRTARRHRLLVGVFGTADGETRHRPGDRQQNHGR